MTLMIISDREYRAGGTTPRNPHPKSLCRNTALFKVNFAFSSVGLASQTNVEETYSREKRGLFGRIRDVVGKVTSGSRRVLGRIGGTVARGGRQLIERSGERIVRGGRQIIRAGRRLIDRFRSGRNDQRLITCVSWLQHHMHEPYKPIQPEWSLAWIG